MFTCHVFTEKTGGFLEISASAAKAKWKTHRLGSNSAKRTIHAQCYISDGHNRKDALIDLVNKDLHMKAEKI